MADCLPLTDRLLTEGVKLGQRGMMVLAFLYRIVDRTLRDGSIHAGNIAYLSLVTLFPAVILIHAATASLGRTAAGQQAILQFLGTLPADVANLVQPVLMDVVDARSGAALAVGAIIALWTTSGFIGTLSDMLRRAHETPPERPFWQERLIAMMVTLGSIGVIIFAFAGRVVLELIVGVMKGYVPTLGTLVGLFDISGATGIAAVFLALWALFRVLTPRSVRQKPAPIWPGPLLVALVWAGSAALLGPFMTGGSGNFSMTYGAFTGVMLAMFFFYIIGFAVVAGAELNAALASRRDVAEMVVQWRRRVRRLGHGDDHDGEGQE